MYSTQNYADFCEKLDEFANLFEFSEGQIWDRYAAKVVPAEIVDLILKKDFSISDIYTFVMASYSHRKLGNNFQRFLIKRLAEEIYTIYSESCLIYIAVSLSFRIPDVVVVENEQINEKNQVLNPLILVEILSPSTAHIDFTQKLKEYKNIPSLREYLIFSQEETKIWQFSKNENNDWQLTEYEHIKDIIVLDCIEMAVPVAVIYKDVI